VAEFSVSNLTSSFDIAQPGKLNKPQYSGADPRDPWKLSWS